MWSATLTQFFYFIFFLWIVFLWIVCTCPWNMHWNYEKQSDNLLRARMRNQVQYPYAAEKSDINTCCQFQQIRMYSVSTYCARML